MGRMLTDYSSVTASSPSNTLLNSTVGATQRVLNLSTRGSPKRSPRNRGFLFLPHGYLCELIRFSEDLHD
jgi:hypothetical protein